MIYGIYDLEIENAIPPKDPADRLPGIEYCSGWTDYANMGIACWAYCELDTDTWKISEPIGGKGRSIFLDQMSRISQEYGTPLGGFHTKGFDDKLMAANSIELQSNFDILEMVIEAAGMAGIKYWELDPKPTYSLAAISEANDYVKTLSGEQAPIEWQRGNKDLVLDYCKNDVRIEAITLERLLKGELIDPNHGNRLFHPGLS